MSHCIDRRRKMYEIIASVCICHLTRRPRVIISSFYFIFILQNAPVSLFAYMYAQLQELTSYNINLCLANRTNKVVLLANSHNTYIEQ